MRNFHQVQEKSPNKITVEFYDQNAQCFFDRTVNIDMQPAIDKFVKYLHPSGHILDAGCGSGRDSKTFFKCGFEVTSIDASIELVKLSTNYLRKPSIHMLFEEMHYESVFDGIWCSASLLHFPSFELASVLKKFKTALKPSGIWFISFMYGDIEEFRSYRFFLHQTQESLTAHLENLGGFTVLEWGFDKSYEVNKNRPWIQCIVRKDS